MTPAVSIRHLDVIRSGKRALEAFSADVPRGKVTGLVGPSGSGKTTLMRSIVGVQRHGRGKITVLGKRAGSAELRRQIGYMAQALSVYEDLSVRENLRYFAAIVDPERSTKARSRAVDTLITDLELADCADRVVRSLSGGQQARVSLGAALLGSPKLLVLDEPTVGLDPVLREKLWRRFRRLARSGTTVLVSSHVMDEAERCDDLILLRDGRLLARGTPRTLRRRTKTETVGDAFLKLVEGGGT